MTTTMTTATTTIFQQYERFQRGVHAFLYFNERYSIVTNDLGATIVDREEWHTLTIGGASLFWPGPEGWMQAEQYIREITPC